MDTNSIIVSHVPLGIKFDTLKDFFSNFGATRISLQRNSETSLVWLMGNLTLFGRFKSLFFLKKKKHQRVSLSFKDINSRNDSVRKIHGLKLMGNVLKVKIKGSHLLEEDRISREKKRRKLEKSGRSSSILEYKYPPINSLILSNISNALISIPEFYVSVLHLMNRMNLPPPFAPQKLVPLGFKEEMLKGESSNFQEEEEEEEGQLILDSISRTNQSSSGTSILEKKELFESMVEEGTKQKILKIKKSEEIGLEKIEKKEDGKENEREALLNEKIEEIRKNRATEEEMASKFPNYERGRVSKKLYIKNLAKEIDEHKIVELFSLYFPSREEALRSLQVKLFTKGRMKGQA